MIAQSPRFCSLAARCGVRNPFKESDNRRESSRKNRTAVPVCSTIAAFFRVILSKGPDTAVDFIKIAGLPADGLCDIRYEPAEGFDMFQHFTKLEPCVLHQFI